MNGKKEFPEAVHNIRDLQITNDKYIKITTSGNQIKKEEIISSVWEEEIEELAEES